MKKVLLIFTISMFLVAMPGKNCLGQTTSLFNGQSLKGWYTFLEDRGRNCDPKGVFSIRDKTIRISGEEWGCITTNEAYENYRIEIEFRWGDTTFEPRKERARDSGLLLNSRGKDGGRNGRWMHSIECQIIEGGTGDFIVIGDGSDDFQITCTVANEKQNGSYVFQPEGKKATIKAGRMNWFNRDPEWKDEIGFRGKNDVENPLGEWNTLECIVSEDQITVFLNGTLVNEATEVRPRKGKIQIQSEGAEIFFRRIDLTPL